MGIVRSLPPNSPKIQLGRCSLKPPLRTKSVGTKVSEAEFALLEERARGAGLRLAEWVREALLAAPGTGRPGSIGSTPKNQAECRHCHFHAWVVVEPAKQLLRLQSED